MNSLEGGNTATNNNKIDFNDENYDFLVNDLSKKQSSKNATAILSSQFSSLSARTKISAETLQILSSANLNNLDYNSRFELMFNDLAMLKSSAVQGILGKNCLRAMAWMVFLECLPFEKSQWADAIATSRRDFQQLREQIFQDPRQSQMPDDHPLSSETESAWNNFFRRRQLRELITQDVIRM